MYITDYVCVDFQYNFEGRYDLVKFLKLIQRHKMFVILRLGPFIQAEWNYGYHFVKLFSSMHVLISIFYVLDLIIDNYVPQGVFLIG